MMYRPNRTYRSNEVNGKRIVAITVLIGLFFGVILARLFFIQVISHNWYKARANEQHLRIANYTAQRGEIYARDRTNENGGTLYPLAINKTFYEVFLNPSEITRPVNTAEKLQEILGSEYDVMLARAKKEGDVYEPVTMKATEEQVTAIEQTGLSGIHWRPQVWRYYPEKDVGSHILGFYGIEGDRRVGKYGIEGYWEQELAGISKEIVIARDGTGGIIPERDEYFDAAVDGSDIVLTIDRTIQFESCSVLREAIDQYAADKGTVIVMESQSGKIQAMCNYPTFDPNTYEDVEDVSVFNNDALFDAYEPGSVFKPIAMAIAIDQGVVTPLTTYEDTGSVTIGSDVLRNFDKKAHGMRTMTQVLQESLNVGAVFATSDVPNDVFYNYIEKFGFGKKTGLRLSQETAGDLHRLKSGGDIYKATASYGQGVNVTALQMISAFNAIANNGILMKPYIVDEVKKSDGVTVTTSPEAVRRVVSWETAEQVTAMLVKVLEEGYDRKGAVEGYYLAGKTGTAEIPERGGYSSRSNHTFIGFGPAHDPQFTVFIRLHNVKNVGYAADSTTRPFHDITQFLLNYYRIPPNR